MKQKNWKKLSLVVISVAAMASLLVGLIVYYHGLLKDVQGTTCKTLDEVLLQEKNNFTRTLGADKEVLKGFSELTNKAVNDKDSLQQLLATMTKSTDFEFATFALPNGDTVNNVGAKSSVSDRDYFKEALSGKTVISKPLKSKIREEQIIAVATPVIEKGKIEGVLIGSLNVKKLNELLMGAFDGFGYTYVATNTGEVIAKTDSNLSMLKSGNLFELLQGVDFYKGDSYELMCQNLLEGKGGHSQYRIDGQRRLMHYAKIDVNDWNIFVLVAPNGVEASANRILENTAILTICITMFFLALLYYNIRSQKQFNKALTKMAFIDEITGSRSFGKFRIDATELINKNTNVQYILVKLDIENFKLINEIYSMEMGNQVLRAISTCLDIVLDKEMDAFARIHADEFIVLVSYEGKDGHLEKKKLFAQKFEDSCMQLIGVKPVMPQGRYCLQNGDTDFDKIYENANFAHRLAKSGEIKELYFDGKVRERAVREKEIESKMEAALADREFRLFLQPKFRLSDEKIVGAEALVRWIAREENVGSKNQTVVYPNEFIPLFEQNGFITKLDFYMFEEACRIVRRWIDKGIEPITISVNFTRIHLSSPSFVEDLCAIANKYSVPHPLLEIELTETAMLGNLDVLEDVLEQLHSVNFTLSMDDFGSGYSSLSLLKNIPVDVIKIDKGFFDYTKNLSRAKMVISGVIDMAKKLKISTVAEGVETQDHIDLLRELGCEIVQGYYYAKPMPYAQLEEKLFTGSEVKNDHGE